MSLTYGVELDWHIWGLGISFRVGNGFGIGLIIGPIAAWLDYSKGY